LLVIVICACLAAAAHAPAGADEILLPDCSNTAYGGRVAPVVYSSGCVGASVNIDGLAWQSWGGPTATATGTLRYNDCEPDCARGTIYDYPAELTAGELKRCASSLGPRLYYTHTSVVVDFPPENAAEQPPGRAEYFSYSTRCPEAGYLVKTRRGPASFGAFTQEGEYDGSRLDNLFGRPSKRSRDSHGYVCVKHWRSIGLTVWLGVFESDQNPCEEGIFLRAILRGSHWHTPSGVRPGAPARKAAAASVRLCTIRLCRTRGFVLSQHYSVCGAGRYPTVIAAAKRGHVSRFLVYSTSCE
jgi:hypothetical protein